MIIVKIIRKQITANDKRAPPTTKDRPASSWEKFSVVATSTINEITIAITGSEQKKSAHTNEEISLERLGTVVPKFYRLLACHIFSYEFPVNERIDEC